MRAHLTQQFVDRVPYTANGTQWYTDTALRGFSLAVGKGVKTFYASSEASGRLLRRRVGHADVLSVAQARKLAADMLVDLRNGIDPKRAETETLSEALETYLGRRRRMKATTKKQYRDAVNLYLGKWLKRDIATLTHSEVDQRHRQVGKRAPYAANGVMRVLRAVLNDARKRKVLLTENPCDAIEWFPESRRKTRIADRLPVWWAAVHQLENPVRAAYFKVVLFTGLRRNEVARLRWDDLDLGDAPTIHIRDPKRGPALTLPLAQQAADVLRDLRPIAEQMRAGTPWCFPAQSRSKHIEEPHEETVPGGIHDLRREWLSTAAEVGIPKILAKAAVGHSLNDDVTTGYMVALDVRGVVQKVADELERRATPVVVELTPEPRAA